MGPVIPCCAGGFSQIKFVRVHGCSARGIRNVKTGGEYKPRIKIPPNTNVITLTKPGDLLSVSSSIKDVIFNSHLQGNTLYPNMHREPNNLTESGRFIQYTFNSINEQQTLKEGETPTAKIKFKNHIHRQEINNIFMNFNNPACDSDEQIETSCKIFCLNKIGPYGYAGRYPSHRYPLYTGCSPDYEIKSMTPAAGRYIPQPPEAQEMNYEGDLEGLLDR